MRHKVGDPLEHALGFQNERRQGDSCQVHARTELRDHAQQDILQAHDLVECSSTEIRWAEPCSRPPIAQHFHRHPPFWRNLRAMLAYTIQCWSSAHEKSTSKTSSTW